MFIRGNVSYYIGWKSNYMTLYAYIYIWFYDVVYEVLLLYCFPIEWKLREESTYGSAIYQGEAIWNWWYSIYLLGFDGMTPLGKSWLKFGEYPIKTARCLGNSSRSSNWLPMNHREYVSWISGYPELAHHGRIKAGSCWWLSGGWTNPSETYDNGDDYCQDMGK